MHDFIISTDNTADLPDSFIQENAIDIQILYYSIGDTIYGKDNLLSPKEFYDSMRNGNMPTTMACNPEEARASFEKHAAAGKDVLYISFSSALSSSFNNFRLAAMDIMEAYPERKILVVDSKGVSLGEGLMVYQAVKMRKAGKTLEETADWLEAHVQNFVQFFTVDNLFHLYRGGRISKGAAVVGSLAGIKPMVHVDEEGCLIPSEKIRGRKKSIQALADKVGKYAGSFLDSTDLITVSHGDCPEDAKVLADMLQERYHKRVVTNYICPTIGSHSGPGTLAVFFMGEKRY